VILTTETGKAEGPRFHSRFLCPGWTLLEDSVTGSAHCLLGVIYVPRFNAVGMPITATQGGKRRGEITVVWDGKEGKDGGRMKLRGKTLTGEFSNDKMNFLLTQCFSRQRGAVCIVLLGYPGVNLQHLVGPQCHCARYAS
jgi:hypothetical protein